MIVVLGYHIGAFFILLEEGAEVYSEGFSSALEEEVQIDVEIASTEPFLWVPLGEDATRDQVQIALENIGLELRWLAGRAYGWSNSW